MEASVFAGIILAPLVLLVVGGVITGLVALFSKPGKAARWILGTLGVICAVGLLLLVAYRFVSYRTSQRARMAEIDPIVAYPHAITAPRPHRPSRLQDSRVASEHTSETWPVENDPKFKPDVYPSVETAARALATEAAETLDRVVPREEAPTRIQIFGDAGPDALHAAAAVLTRPGPGPIVTVEAIPPKRGPQTRPADGWTVRMLFEVPPITKSGMTTRIHRATVHSGSGSLRMRVEGPAGEFTRSVRFVGKPWAENFAEFVSRNPQRRWVLATSAQPCTSQYDAERRALQDAAKKLLPEIRRHLRVRRHPGRGSGARPSTEEMLAIIEATLRDHQSKGIVVDRFAQRFVRPYGQVWREAVLVDASSDSISRVANTLDREVRHRQRSYEHEIREQKRSWLERGLSIGALLVMVCLLYLFLNTATKGYYLWSLRTGAVAVVIAGALAVLALI